MTTSAAGVTATLLQLVLDRASPVTLNRQLYVLLRDLILSGRLAGGARLPSTRRLAIDLSVSRTVTLAAYDQLVDEGYLWAKRGSGQFVRTLDRKPGRASSADEDAAQPPATRVSTTRGKPFDPDAPAAGLFPTREWARLIARGWRREGDDAVAGDHWGGLPSLRAAIAAHLRAMQGLDCTPDQVVITGGNDDALQLIVRALGLAGKEVWIENPGYNGARNTFDRLGMTARAVPVDDEGLDVAAGRCLAPAARLALVTPSRQFPLGMPMSLPRRLALIDWAREHGAIVVEDDYDSELRFSGRPMASLMGLDQYRSVLAIGSLSKLMFAGLRLGYVIGPARLAARLVDERARRGVPVATSAQPALAAFIADGGFAKHLGVLRRAIAQRRAALIGALQEHIGDRITIPPQEVGMLLTVLLTNPSEPAVDVRIAALAAQGGLHIESISEHAQEAVRFQGFQLGYAAWEEPALRQAVATLARLMDDASGCRLRAVQVEGQPEAGATA